MKKFNSGILSLSLLTISSIVSLRNLPFSAEFGFSSVFFLFFASFVFFIPISLVVAELSSTWPSPGCCYTWVEKAFGKNWGLFTLWSSWVGCVIWFPTVLAFTGILFINLILPFFPFMANNNNYLFVAIIFIFWFITFMNFGGIRLSSIFSSVGVFLGTILPGFLIIFLGFLWFFSGKKTLIDFNLISLIPSFKLDNIVIFSAVLLSFAGIEMAAFHIKDFKDIGTNYPKVIFFSVFIILFIYILGTLSISMIVPREEICLASGLIQAFNIFFLNFDIHWIIPFLNFFLLIGSLASINSWAIGPSKGLLFAANDGFLPNFFKYTNSKNVPVFLLILQAFVGSILSLVFLFFNSTNSAIWILTALSAQFTMLQYFMIFLAVIFLRFKSNKQRPYKVPFLKFFALLGILSCIFSFFIVYIPPNQLDTGINGFYQILLVVIFLILILPVFFLIYFKNVN